jgi:hypothetical protein
VKIRVLHRYYGCETGCCGHVLEIDGEEVEGSFDFWHPDEYGFSEDIQDFILARVPKECHDNIDWDSIEIVGGC